jgi:hypothetical protein
MQKDINPTVETINQKNYPDLSRCRGSVCSFLELQEKSNCIFWFNPLLIKGESVVKIRNMTILDRTEDIYE